MKKVFFSLCFLTASTLIVNAQDEFDALRYSQTQLQGTARSQGIGGAMGSIGADFSSLSINPAGIGIYRSGEFSFSPSFSTSGNDASYLGTTATSKSSKLSISNFGIVVANTQPGGARRSKKSGWKAFNFGLGMNRLATLKNEYTYKGYNNKNSFIEHYAEDFNALGGLNSNSLSEVSFGAYGAYQTYLIDRGIGSDSSKAVSYVPYTAGLNQSKRVTESGGMNEYLLSLGGNYEDKLMLGATMGINSVKYNRTLQFNEEDASGNLNNDFKYMYFTERLNTSGTGINLKLGGIYKPSAAFRMGLAFHTPTFIQLNDASAIEISSHTDSLLTAGAPQNSPITTYRQDSALVFNYSMNTPYKAILSAAVFFGKKGFLTADFEYVDFSSMRYNYGAGYENATSAINSVIQNTYQGAVNLRIGAEARLDNINIRAGMAYYGSPYKNNSGSGDRTNISAGIGYRNRFWFLDAAYTLAFQENREYPYLLERDDANIQAANIKSRRGTMALTLGFKF